MTPDAPPNRLDRPVDEAYDHILGPPDAEITLVEYGSYADASSRAAHERVARLRHQFGDRLRYVFRHRPLPGNDIARRAAELVESYADPARFWNVHVALMTYPDVLTEDDLNTIAADQVLEVQNAPDSEEGTLGAKARVDADIQSAADSGVLVTPTFFINDRRYDGPWDGISLSEAMLGSLGHVVHAAALDFAKWAPSTGLLLLVGTALAMILSNTAAGPYFNQFWDLQLGVVFDGGQFNLSLRHWINDSLLVIFFLVVGLEIKREFTVGHLATRQSAMLPVAAAIGGMAVPAVMYTMLVPAGPEGSEGAWRWGWGVPMATDTAFAVALIAMMGRRVPVELRVFLTAAAIVDDIGAILVVAAFYTDTLQAGYLAGAAAITGLLAVLNRAAIYRPSPYVLLGIGLWVCVHGSGVHASLAGIVLALFIPTRPPPNIKTLMLQADAILSAEMKRGREVMRYGPSVSSLEALDAIHDRLESPAERMLRYVAPRSSYLVLPLFALANAGVVLDAAALAGREALMLGTTAALVAGKPLGFIAATLLAVKLGIAAKPRAYTWRQLAGAGALAGIGFTMSLFIASQAFSVDADFAAAKIAIFTGSVLSAIIGTAILWFARMTPPDSRPERASAN